jgi:type VI secretion system protein ImpM
MSRALQPAPISCFGKLSARGDFVKATTNPPLIATLDRWVSQTMEMLAQEARWKQLYDAVPPIDFAFMGTRSRLAIGGHMRMSMDSSERRFPFMAVAPVEVEQPLEFVARSPLALSRLWQRLNVVATELMLARDPSELLQSAGNSRVAIDVTTGSYEAIFKDFTEMHSIESLQTLLQGAGHEVNMRRAILALGMLLQPVMASGTTHLDKGLRLPLPADAMYRPLVAAFWMELIVRFLARAEFELVVFVENLLEKPSLLVTFSGAAPEALHSVFDPAANQQRNIFLDDPEWVNDHAESDYGMAKLSSYLAQPQLTLHSALATFREVFIGA